MIKKLLFFVSLFVLLSPKTYADTYNYDQFTAQLYDNISGSLSERTTIKGDNYWTGQVGLTAYSSGAAWGFNSPTAIVNGHTYSLTVNFSTNNQSYSDIVFSSINRIGLGTSLSNAKSSYQNATNTNLVYSNNSNGTLQFVFDANTTGSYLVVPFATSYSINLESVYFNNFVISDLGSSSDVSQDSINNSLNSQTNELNNYINNSTNTITGAITDVEDSINNTINDNFKSCPDPINLSYSTGKKFNTSGILIDDSSFSYTEDYYSFDSSHKITFKNVGTSNVGYVILYDSSKEQIGYFGIRDRTITSPSAVYYRLSTNNLNLQVYLGTGECTNKIDETNSQLGDLNSSLNNSDTSDATNQAEDFFSGFSTDTFGLTSIITAPLNLIGNITSSSCSPVGLPLPYVDKTLNLPCLSSIYQQYFGSFLTIYQTITFGIVAYWVCIRIFALVKDFKNPDHDEIEVLDL